MYQVNMIVFFFGGGEDLLKLYTETLSKALLIFRFFKHPHNHNDYLASLRAALQHFIRCHDSAIWEDGLDGYKAIFHYENETLHIHHKQHSEILV